MQDAAWQQAQRGNERSDLKNRAAEESRDKQQLEGYGLLT